MEKIIRRGAGTGPGTCGELVQGITTKGINFHVTMPINLFSAVGVRMIEADKWSFVGQDNNLSKTCAAIRLASEHFGLGPQLVDISHHSTLQTSKGLGSSTADIIAGMRAVADALRKVMTYEEEGRYAAKIESSDGSMFPGLVAFEQGTGKLIEQYNWWPRFAIAMVIPSQLLLTSSVDFSKKIRDAPRFDAILDSLQAASRSHDGEAFAHAATLSAEINQHYVVNELFSPLLEMQEELGADGVNIGHTGTVASMLYLLPEENSKNHDSIRANTISKVEHSILTLRKTMPSDYQFKLVTTPACHNSNLRLSEY